ncbi:MAG: RluA family pseudouridine synthase [Planctomycetota bacterium]
MTTEHRTVPTSDTGLRLDQFLARLPEVGSRARARELIDAGKVRVGGAEVRPALLLEAGQRVEFEPPPRTGDRLLGAVDDPPPELRVLHADEWILAIDKPPGLLSHPPEGREFAGHSVAGAARQQFGALPLIGGEDRPGIVHRLDRDTSGVMLLARTEAAFQHLRAQWQARTVHKEYRCIAFGESRFDSDWIERAIATDPAHGDRMTVVQEGGREAATYYEVVERFAGFTHFRCQPRTGRTHQIRVHMTSIGHSLVGDRVYRSRRAQHKDLPADAPHPQRQCLHALRLVLEHPGTGGPLELEAPLPDDMQELLRWLRSERPPRR